MFFTSSNSSQILLTSPPTQLHILALSPKITKQNPHKKKFHKMKNEQKSIRQKTGQNETKY